MRLKTRNKAIKLMIFIGILITILSINNPAFAFSDVKPDDWYYKNIMDLRDRGIIDGYTDNTFRPLNNVTHGESIKLLAVLSNSDIPDDNQLLPVRTINLPEYAYHWSERYIQAALDKSILEIPTNGLDYDKKATRLETVRYIVNYIDSEIGPGVVPKEIVIGSAADSYFEDAHGKAMDYLYENKIIEGSPAKNRNEFRGLLNVTRAEYSAMMDRAERFVLKTRGTIEKPIEEPEKEVITDKYALINNTRTINYEVNDLLYNNFEIEKMIKVFYYLKYHNLESITLTYSGNHYDNLIQDGKFNAAETEKFRKAFSYTMSSYPELFFNENRFTMGFKVNSDRSLEATISIVSPLQDRAESIRRRTEFDKKMEDKAKELIDNETIREDMTQVEIARALNFWLNGILSYDYNFADDSYDGYGSLKTGKAVCNGYTAIYNKLLSLYGINVVSSTGYSRGEKHIWTEAILDNRMHYIDSTWNDDGSGTLKYFTTNRTEFSYDRDWDYDFFNQYRQLIP